MMGMEEVAALLLNLDIDISYSFLDSFFKAPMLSIAEVSGGQKHFRLKRF